MKIIEIYIKINRLKKGDSVKNQNPLFSFYKEKRGNSPFTLFPFFYACMQAYSM